MAKVRWCICRELTSRCHKARRPVSSLGSTKSTRRSCGAVACHSPQLGILSHISSRNLPKKNRAPENPELWLGFDYGTWREKQDLRSLGSKFPTPCFTPVLLVGFFLPSWKQATTISNSKKANLVVSVFLFFHLIWKKISPNFSIAMSA